MHVFLFVGQKLQIMRFINHMGKFGVIPGSIIYNNSAGGASQIADVSISEVPSDLKAFGCPDG